MDASEDIEPRVGTYEDEDVQREAMERLEDTAGIPQQPELIFGMPADPTAASMRRSKPVNKVQSISAPQVMKSLADIAKSYGANTPIRVGGLTGRKNRAEYKHRPEVISIRQANDIIAASHELGHDMAKIALSDVADKWTPAMQRELHSLGKKLYGPVLPAAGYQREGFAEFIRLYITQPDKAKSRSPKFHRWFQSWLS